MDSQLETPVQQQINVNGVALNVALLGAGPALLLVHGWPQTWRVWSQVMPSLARTHRVIAVDLRGMGASERVSDGYDAQTMSNDLAGLLTALGVPRASVVAIDAGVPVAFMLAMRRPELIERLVLMESTLGPLLPGAESFFAAGAPWWFGFHGVPGLAESVLAGHEAEYIGHFLDGGLTDRTRLADDVRAEIIAAYSGTDSLRAGFGVYRTMPISSQQMAGIAGHRRLSMPVMAIGARPVGENLHRQLDGVSDNLVGHVIEDCGHMIPVDCPEALLALLGPFLDDGPDAGLPVQDRVASGGTTGA